MNNSKMVFEHEETGITFEKYPKAATVNIYVNGENVDCFTHYDIGADFEKFEASCMEYINEME